MYIMLCLPYSIEIHITRIISRSDRIQHLLIVFVPFLAQTSGPMGQDCDSRDEWSSSSQSIPTWKCQRWHPSSQWSCQESGKHMLHKFLALLFGHSFIILHDLQTFCFACSLNSKGRGCRLALPVSSDSFEDVFFLSVKFLIFCSQSLSFRRKLEYLYRLRYTFFSETWMYCDYAVLFFKVTLLLLNLRLLPYVCYHTKLWWIIADELFLSRPVQ